MTKKALLEQAKGLGITVPATAKKEEIEKLIPDNWKACCLGVAAIVLDMAEFKDEVLLCKGHDGTLPKEAYDMIGLNTGCGETSGKIDNALTVLNDSYNKTFAEIADILEKNPSKYFTKSV